MPYSTELYRNLPLYARLADQESGRVLEHVCNAIQPNLDLIRDRLTNRGYIYDLQTTPPEWLDWLQQFVGGAPIGDQWQGLGLNPDWSDAHKRRVLGRLWRYWQVKGTDWGIREAIALWLQFEAAHTARFEIRLPFGKTPASTPPNWWGYDTPYDAYLYQLYPERQHLGSGDYLPGVLHQPRWIILQQSEWVWDYDMVWSDRVLTTITPEQKQSQSHLGPQRPWQHFYLETDQEWQSTLPDLYRLNPEIWSSFAVPTAFIWLVETIPPLKLEENRALPRQETLRELTIDGFQYTDVYPFPARPETQALQATETVREFWLEGCTYTDWWAGLGGVPRPTEDRLITQTVTQEGVYPGAEYERDWYSAIVVTTSVITTPYDGNYTSAFASYDGWETAQWYFSPGETIVENPLPPVSYGGLPFYCPTVVKKQLIIDPSQPATTQPYPGTQWRVSLKTVVERVETTVIVPAVPCIPGMLTPVTVGTETVIVGADAGAPASQLLELVPGNMTTVETSPATTGTIGFQWGDWWLSVQRTRLASIDLSALAPIDLSALGSLAAIDGVADVPFTPNLVQSEETMPFGTELWYPVAAQPAVEQTIVTLDDWQLLEPVRVATYDLPYGLGYPWYNAGRPPASGSVETRPVTQLVPLCNVVDNWTLREILVWNEYQVTLPEAELGYGLTDVYPLLAKVLNGDQWTLLLETREQIIVLQPTTMLWTDDDSLSQRASYYSEEEGLTQLVLEFIVQPQTSSQLQSLTLILDEQAIYGRRLEQLDYSPPGCFGFRFLLPMQTVAMTL